jgi:23S rRNA (cytidine1920-2'-O)/16S rRNA (cytidine1409-2'-O)-methyltransferase
VVADVSFAPLRTLLVVLSAFLREGGTLIALIKPQFELAGAEVGRGGVISDPAAHVRAIELATEAAAPGGLAPQALCFSPLKGPKGNIEFFLLAQQGGIPATIDISGVVSRAHACLD